MAFADGRTTWDQRSTALRHENWFDFRDPNELWERPFYQQEAAYERQIEEAVAVARHDRRWQRLNPDWIEFLRANMQQQAYVEQGMWLVLASTARACLSDTITHWVAFQAGMKQRAAQAVVLYAMDLEEDLGEFSMDAAQRSWMEDEPWQPARRFVERMNTILDWGEVLVAVNLCLEPLVGVLLRRELLERGAAANRDTTTPVVFNAAQSEWTPDPALHRRLGALRGLLARARRRQPRAAAGLDRPLDCRPPAGPRRRWPRCSAPPRRPVDLERAMSVVDGELAESLRALELEPNRDVAATRWPSDEEVAPPATLAAQEATSQVVADRSAAGEPAATPRAGEPAASPTTPTTTSGS